MMKSIQEYIFAISLSFLDNDISLIDKKYK